MIVKKKKGWSFIKNLITCLCGFEFPYNQPAKRIVKSDCWAGGVAFIIFCNFVVSIWYYQVVPEVGSQAMRQFQVLELIFGVTFCIELLVNFYAHGPISFFGKGWNLFDAFIITVSLLAIQYETMRSLQALRMFRAFRAIRLCKRVPVLRRQITGILYSILGVVNGLLVLFIFMAIWSILATTIFAHKHDEFFGTFAKSMFTMWQCMTFDSWSSGVARTIVFDEKGGIGAALFFISYIYVVGILIFNVVATSLLEKYISMERYGPSIIKREIKRSTKETLINLLFDTLQSSSMDRVPKQELSWLCQAMWRHDATMDHMRELVDKGYWTTIAKKTSRSVLLDLLFAQTRREEQMEQLKSMSTHLWSPGRGSMMHLRNLENAFASATDEDFADESKIFERISKSSRNVKSTKSTESDNLFQGI